MSKNKIKSKELQAAIDKYFSSLSKMVPVYEDIPVEEPDELGNMQLKKDSKGNQVYTQEKVINELGQPVMQRYYAVPPGLTALCNNLGLLRQDWTELAEDRRYCDIIANAEARIREYLEVQLTTRTKSANNIIYALNNKHSFTELIVNPDPGSKFQFVNMTLQEKIDYIESIKNA